MSEFTPSDDVEANYRALNEQGESWAALAAAADRAEVPALAEWLRSQDKHVAVPKGRTAPTKQTAAK